MTDLYVLEWSHKSNGFHVQPLEMSAGSNRQAFTENRATHYILIGTGTRDQMSELAEELRPVLKYRNADRSGAA